MKLDGCLMPGLRDAPMQLAEENSNAGQANVEILVQFLYKVQLCDLVEA